MAYPLYLAILYCLQDRLIFPGIPLNRFLYKRLHRFSENIISDGYQLQGWAFPSNNKRSKYITIYFGGSIEDAGERFSMYEQLDAATVYAFNYRSYGLSEGNLSEENIYLDALSVYDFVVNKHPSKTIVVLGYSLGTAVAGYVAANRPVKKLILISPLSVWWTQLKRALSTLSQSG